MVCYVLVIGHVLLPLKKQINENYEWQRHPIEGRLIANNIFSLIYNECCVFDNWRIHVTSFSVFYTEINSE